MPRVAPAQEQVGLIARSERHQRDGVAQRAPRVVAEPLQRIARRVGHGRDAPQVVAHIINNNEDINRYAEATSYHR